MKQSKPNNYLSGLFVLVQFVCIGIIILGWNLNGVLDNLVFWLGVLIGLWAILEMKFKVNIFPNVRKSQKLYTTGIYKYIRHPMYLAVLLVTGSYLISNFEVTLIGVWLLLLVDLLFKLKYEESLLLVKFKDYAEYKKTTKKLIPLVF